MRIASRARDMRERAREYGQKVQQNKAQSQNRKIVVVTVLMAAVAAVMVVVVVVVMAMTTMMAVVEIANVFYY
ncbi:hypothetical protein ACSBR1_039030 [Camellia fascicularis]